MAGRILISSNGLQVSDNTDTMNFPIVFAKKGFPISGELSRKEDDFPGTILYYFEVTQLSEKTQTNGLVKNFLIKNFSFGPISKNNSLFSEYYVGLSEGNTFDELSLVSNSYCVSDDGIVYENNWPTGVNGVLKRNCPGNVAGCALLLNSENKLFIFITFNGLLGN
jgi:hypothetical protein